MSGYLVVFGLILPWFFAGLAFWLVFQLLRQNGRILVKLEALEKRVRPQAPETEFENLEGLPVGTPAPEFTLPDLAGTPRSLSEFRGRRVLAIFFNPGCGFCEKLAPELGGLSPDGPDWQPVPLIVSTGTAEENRALIEAHGIHCPVLLQKRMEIAEAYGAKGTPMGYLIDDEGRIASDLVAGADALLELVSLASAIPTQERNGSATPNGHAPHEHHGNRPISESRLNRSGLVAGTPAPEFRLPRVDGGDLSLGEFRGRRVLLVFSDPDCVPCDELAPQLERLHRSEVDVGVVMVSRGSLEANRAKSVEHGFTFPVALQRQWEISRLFAMFATPIGYLIDEGGVIAADVAVGTDAILELVSGAADEAHRKPEALEREKGGMPLVS